MSNPEKDEPLLDVAHGDPAMSRHVRDSLKVLAERTDDPEFGKLVEDVLRGRRSLRDVAFTPAFERTINPGVAQFAERYEQLSEEEREELAAQGERQLAEQREASEGQPEESATHDDDDDPDSNEWRDYLR